MKIEEKATEEATTKATKATGSPNDCSLLWHVSKSTLQAFLFYSLVFRSPDLLLYRASQFGHSVAATIRDSDRFRDALIH